MDVIPLTQHMHLEADSVRDTAPSCSPVINGRAAEIPVSYAQMPNGKQIKLLKAMITSACERNCYYCPFRAGRDYRRSTFKPDEMAKTFYQIHQAGMVEGLFLSSGIVAGSISTQDKLLDTAEILRKRYQYRGYLHLKIMPGAEKEQVRRAMQLASRLSVNLEAPNDHRLGQLAPTKQFVDELLQPLKWVEEIRREESPRHTWNGRYPSTTTQFVVGAAGESDVELLTTTEYLTHELRLQRAYFSRFSPIQDTPLENHPAENPLRNNRLYQASFLLRDYGFALEEMPFAENGFLPLDADPKLAWAKGNLEHAPIEINHGTRDMLLRVPGIGPKLADAIIRQRRKGRIRSLSDLRKLGVSAKRAAPFILLAGKRPAHQLSFML